MSERASLCEARHQHRFTPAMTTSSGPPQVWSMFRCRCGRTVTEHPPMRVKDWRWKWLSGNGLRREWLKRSKKMGMVA